MKLIAAGVILEPRLSASWREIPAQAVSSDAAMNMPASVRMSVTIEPDGLAVMTVTACSGAVCEEDLSKTYRTYNL